MYYIYNNERITQKELADKMSIKEPSVVRLIQKMESEGFLYRLESVKDKRIKQLELSPKGEKGYHELLPIAENFKNYVVEGIPEEDLEIFKQVLETMTKNAVKE